jgi:hypothetical protein
VVDSQSTIFDDTLSDAKQQQLLVAAKANLFERHETFSVAELGMGAEVAGAHNMMRIVFQPDTWARRGRCGDGARHRCLLFFQSLHV